MREQTLAWANHGASPSSRVRPGLREREREMSAMSAMSAMCPKCCAIICAFLLQPGCGAVPCLTCTLFHIDGWMALRGVVVVGGFSSFPRACCSILFTVINYSSAGSAESPPRATSA